MIDTVSILLTHCLLLLTAWRLLGRADLDQEADDPVGRKGMDRDA